MASVTKRNDENAARAGDEPEGAPDGDDAMGTPRGAASNYRARRAGIEPATCRFGDGCSAN